MAEGDELKGASISQLLFSDDAVMGLEISGAYRNYCSFSTENPPKMLYFGDYDDSGVTCSASSSASSTNTSIIKALSISNKKTSWSGTGAPEKGQVTGKRSKSYQNTVKNGHAKVRKEKLGERVTALQQLVSPFGKTDTASVLHEAMGYIKFLHDQVQIMCSPYLQHLPEEGENGESDSGGDLRSRGLCLVPVSCTVHVASSNGADFWSPAAMKNVSSNR